MQVEIKGVIVMALDRDNKLDFIPRWDRSYFNEDGVYKSSYAGSDYLFLSEHTIATTVPDFDTTKLKLKSLDAKEKELRAKFSAELTHINNERSKLLAISNEVSND